MQKGQNSSSIRDIIHRREKTRSVPSKRQDPYKLGIIIEGGCMSSVVTAGMVSFLEDFLKTQPFDEGFAISGGAAALLFWASGGAKTGSVLFHKELIKFISFKRGIVNELMHLIPFIPVEIRSALSKRIGTLIDFPLAIEIARKSKALDWKKIVNSSIPLHTYATNMSTLMGEDFYPYGSEKEVFDALDAGCRIPYICTPKEINGMLYFDGGIALGGLPLDHAIDAGCTHILIFATGKINQRGGNPKNNLAYRFLSTRLQHQELRTLFWQGREKDRTTFQTIHNAVNGVISYPKIEVVEVEDDSLIPRMVETNPQKLRNGWLGGYKAAEKFFNLKD